jgi:hypothetical protein
MGYIRHHAIMITGWQEEAVQAAADHAKALGMTVLGPSDQVVNGYRHVFICPDGSKEGWEASDRGDEARDAMVAWLKDGAIHDRWLSWVEVNYGGDDDERCVIVRHSGQEASPGTQTTDVVDCMDCGASWRDDGKGWRDGTGRRGAP